MKKIAFIFLLHGFLPLASAQYTYVPDDDFEQELINQGYDSGPLDSMVLTANISSITSLDISVGSIQDLTGIQDFVSLISLDCSENNIHTGFNISNCLDLEILDCSDNILYTEDLDLSNNIALKNLNCSKNHFTILKFAGNPLLEILNCSDNDLHLLNVASNTALTNLDCTLNELKFLDLSNCSALTSIACYGNYLIYLNVKNGNNLAITYFNSFWNTSLTCIQVDDAVYSTTNWTGISAESSFSENCNYAYTFIPDNGFEQRLIDLDFDTGSPNEYVKTESIDTITSLNLISAGISDLTGIVDFVTLKNLYVGNNALTTLDLSENLFIERVLCNLNQLESINMKNGNNTAITDFITFGNPDLTCIEVDDVAYSTLNWTLIDPSHTFSSNCFLSTQDDHQFTFELFPNPATNTVYVTLQSSADYFLLNLNGQIILNGTMQEGENNLFINDLPKGIYFISIIADGKQDIQKLIVY